MSGNVFGSGDLTPEMLRSVQLPEHEGYIPASEVYQLLDRIASALEVLKHEEPEAALRAEFHRNAEIAQQVLDAGTAAAEQLRSQAQADASAILSQTQQAAEQLIAAAQSQIEVSRAGVDEMRTTFIQELRDLYDRLGSSLYRFERAASDAPATSPVTGSEPSAGDEPQQPPEPVDTFVAADVAAADAYTDHDSGEDEEPPAKKHMPPAWTQLEQDASAASAASYSPPAEPQAETAGPAAPQPTPDAAADTEDEPLAPGEPLVDLSQGFGDSPEPPGASAPAASAEPAAAPEPQADDERAEQLIQSMGDALDQGLQPQALQEPSPNVADPSAATPGAAPPAAVGNQGGYDPDAVRQLVQESLNAGVTRDALEAHLRDNLGIADPTEVVDSALMVSTDDAGQQVQRQAAQEAVQQQQQQQQPPQQPPADGGGSWLEE